MDCFTTRFQGAEDQRMKRAMLRARVLEDIDTMEIDVVKKAANFQVSVLAARYCLFFINCG